MLHVDSDIPAGNGIIEAIDGDTITLRPDLRDTDGEWFYWHIRVRGCQGRRITLRFSQAHCLSVRGAAVSLDQGKSWQWATEHIPYSNSCSYACGDVDECWLSMGMPYSEQCLQRFLATCSGQPALRQHVLCTSRKGRRVPWLELGPKDDSELYQVALSARHHCCEMMASYTLEGIIGFLLERPDLLSHTRFFIIPMVDYDGCVDGDQGKARRPHDHNRDYNAQPIYPETAAYQNLLRSEADQRLRLALDLHCPYIFGDDWNHHIYMVGNGDPQIWERQQAFAKQLEHLRQGPLPYAAARNLAFGQAWNTGQNYSTGTSCARWICQQFADQVMASTFEIPYANADGIAVTEDSARAFGRDLGAAISASLTSEP